MQSEMKILGIKIGQGELAGYADGFADWSQVELNEFGLTVFGLDHQPEVLSVNIEEGTWQEWDKVSGGGPLSEGRINLDAFQAGEALRLGREIIDHRKKDTRFLAPQEVEVLMNAAALFMLAKLDVPKISFKIDDIKTINKDGALGLGLAVDQEAEICSLAIVNKQ